MTSKMSDKGHRGASPSATRAADEYEAKYMGAAGEIIHREKAIAPLSWQLVFGSIVGVELIAMIAMLLSGAGPMALAIFLPGALVFFMLWMLFAVLRVTVSTDAFHVQFGVFGPRIPIASITTVESIQYDWKEYGGWGLKRSFKDGTAMYNMWGDDGRAVKVTYVNEKGKTCRVAVGSANADTLAIALQRARAGVRVETSEAARVRVAVPEEEVVEVERADDERNASQS